jgi:methionine-gamma-lyase
MSRSAFDQPLSTVRTGDAAIVSDTTCEAVRRLFTDPQPRRHGVEATFVDASDIPAVHAAMAQRASGHTTAIVNPTTRAAAISALTDVAHEAGALLSVDSTFTPPPLHRPLDDGADLVVHSLATFVN